MTSPDNNLASFHPLVAAWFREQVGVPTDVQAAAWPRIAAGEHVLITAPTGSGKTLTAFLSALNHLITGEYPSGHCSVLYISPLKALNNDIQRNLLRPLNELQRTFEEQGVEFPNIRVLTRSGDTPTQQRRAMQRRPPEILITTPESLNLLLSSQGGISMLGSLRTVILDEIHAVIDTKRGAHLISGVERLVRHSGEFQRIALSATVRPLDLVAEFVGGYRLEGGEYLPRPVTKIVSAQHKIYQVAVQYPERELNDEGTNSTWPPIVRASKEIIRRNRSTLLFTNARRLAETITWKINTDEPELIAYAHHGSLSREIRAEVERRLKAGKLRAIVATNSLEMGIDIGALDEVVLIQSPPGIASAIQRVGRAGHQVGEVSRATLFATHMQDLLHAAVLARNILQGNIEQAHAIRCPLDVLSQVIISMTGMETWDLNELFMEIRRAYPFRTLTREQFELVLEMLAGRYADTRIRELNARISIDRLDNTVSARPGALQSLYTSGGMIPDRGYFRLRHQESGALIGELDEEYVWEASTGQSLTFGTQSWRIERITHNDVFVTPAGLRGRQVPFWKGEEQNRDAHFAEQIALFLEEANARLEDPEFPGDLQRDYCLSAHAAEELIDYLKRQKAFCGCDLPHRHHLVIEQVESGPDGYPGTQVIIHTNWGGKVNRPYALALAAAWDERFGEKLEIYPTDDALYLLMTDAAPAVELLTLVSSARLEELLRGKLEGSGFFGARFRECAGRALLLTKRRINERMPLWVSRLRSKRLLDAVGGYGDFPILLEAWRTCLQDEFDLERLRALLAECESGAVTVSTVRLCAPSPFAQTVTRRQIHGYMYADDTPTGRTDSKLRPDLLREVVFSPELRPALAPDIIKRFVLKRRRIAPGYAPQSARDLLDWVKERLLIPKIEWEELLAAILRDHALDEAELLKGNSGKLALLTPPGGEPLIVAVESLPRLRTLWGDGLRVASLHGRLAEAMDDSQPDEEGLTDILAEWLRFYGPVSRSFLAGTLGLPADRLTPLLDDLLDTRQIIDGQLIRDGEADAVCDGDNFEILLRMARAAAIPEVQPQPAEEIPHFLARWQGLTSPGTQIDDLWDRLQQLSGFPARAELWEEAILPARLCNYETVWLDSLRQEGNLHWIGVEKGKVAFCLEDDLPLLTPGEMPADDLRDLLPDAHARYPLSTLSSKSPLRMAELVARLWEGVWRGVISNDTTATLRRGITTGFQAPKLPDMESRGTTRRIPRGSFNRWSSATPFAGNWYRLPDREATNDLLEGEETAKDRARLLLARYGILFRELLQGELPSFQWPAVFRALRLMELSGEVLTGSFFHGVSGLQFISHRGLQLFQRQIAKPAVWWLNACDPISCYGLPLESFKGRLPRRVPGNFVVYHGAEPVAFILRNGKELQFNTAPDNADFSRYLAPLHALLNRRFQPLLRLTVEAINGDNPCQSPYLEQIAAEFDVVRDSNRVFIGKRLR